MLTLAVFGRALALSVAVIVPSAAVGEQGTMRDLMPDKIWPSVKQDGDEQCFIDLGKTLSNLRQGLRSDCAFEVVEDPAETVGRFYIHLNWQTAKVLETSAEVNVCNAATRLEFGFRKKYSEIDSSRTYSDEDYAFVEIASQTEALLYQMNQAGANFLSQELAKAASAATRDICAE